MATFYTLRHLRLAAAACLAASLSTLGSGDDATCHIQYSAVSLEGTDYAAEQELAEESEEEEEEVEAALVAHPEVGGRPELHDRVLLDSQPNKDVRIVVATVTISDLSRCWSPQAADQPDWMRMISTMNMAILRRHGHGMVTRESPKPLPIFPWQQEVCGAKVEAEQDHCEKNYLRENANWQKEAVMAKYLQEPGLTHVVVMDADVVLLKQDRDTLGELAQELDSEGKDIMLADEDWRPNGVGKVNGGFILAKVTNFTKHFFSEIMLSHEEGPQHLPTRRCVRNEQLCIQARLADPEMKGRVLLKSGKMYNCHPKVIEVDGIRNTAEGLRPLNDSSLHVLHFMGSAKAVAPRILTVLSNLSRGHGMQSARPLALSRTSSSEAPSTCNNGSATAPCFTVEECLASPPVEELSGDEKYAFVLSHSLEMPLKFPLPNLASMQYAAERHGIDVLFMVPQDGRHPLDDARRLELSNLGVKLVEVPWSLPPGMRYMREGSWCGRKDLMRLHLLNLTGYSAVAFYDNDVQIQGDVLPALRCAARGYFLSTSGPMSPMNLGFMAVRPSSSLMEAALDFARRADYSDAEGWGGAGFLPARRKFVGAECGQGFFHTLLYKQTELSASVLRRAGARISARQLDRCEWNYQRACPRRGFECSSVRAHHKGGGAECWKFDLAGHPEFY